MVQYTGLTGTQQTSFIADQDLSIRKPTFSVWIAGIDDPSDDIYMIDTNRAIESPRGRGAINIGSGIITASNDNSLFLSNGISQIERNAKVKIWAGFDKRNIPVFSGIVTQVEPDIGSNRVLLYLADYMGLFLEVIERGHQGPTNNTVKLILESFTDGYLLASNIASTDENTEVLTNSYIELKRKLGAMEELADMVFSVPHFDENGAMQMKEREYKNVTTWAYTDENVGDCEQLADSGIINSVEVEYEENFLVRWEDQTSIDNYGLRRRALRLPMLNSDQVSSYFVGSTTEEIGDGSNTLEGFKITSASGTSTIGCVAIKLQQSSASGYVTCKIYTDSGGSPNTLLGTSLNKASGGLSTWFAWEYFYFETAVDIDPSTDYWVIFDLTSVTGTVETQISATTATAKHAYYDGSWSTENDKRMRHEVRGSRQAQRIAEDMVRFHKEPHERIKITAPAVPQLQMFDEVLVDLSKPFIVKGRFIIEGRRTIITPDTVTTIDKLRRSA